MKLNFKEKYLIILMVLCFVAVGFYYSYAIFVTKQLQENVVVVKTLNHDVDLKVNGNNHLAKIKANQKEDVNITFTNKENNNYYYLVLVKGIKEGVKVSSDDSTHALINANETKNIIVHVNNENNEDIELEFIVQISLQEDMDKEMGYSYINPKENYDHTGANAPEIGSLKLIPVTYHKTSETEGYWVKASLNNDKSLWYDYDNNIWANAVLVDDNNFKKYQNLSVDSEIEISDVLGFYVWIPRFKYAIINNSNYTNYERVNNIVFENNNNVTGTVVCQDKISTTEDKHLYSEVCHDDTYHHIYDNLSTYTHPAFQNRNGFWVSKFVVGEGEKVLPNIQILKKKLKDANTISEKISKSHVLTNMEYGAVILLSNSLYGKSGNSLYNDDNIKTFQRIYANLYEHEVTGCGTEYTTYSKNFITEKTNKCIEYNNLTNISHYSNGVYYPIGYVGAGSSSTGNVYGVYDLASINGELVSAYTAKEDGSINKVTNYFNVYSYNDYIGKIFSSSNIHNLYRYKFGDAIKEHFRSSNENGMWHGGTLIQNVNTGVLVRGGTGNTKDASVYTTVIQDIEYTAPFRLVLNY